MARAKQIPTTIETTGTEETKKVAKRAVKTITKAAKST